MIATLLILSVIAITITIAASTVSSSSKIWWVASSNLLFLPLLSTSTSQQYNIASTVLLLAQSWLFACQQPSLATAYFQLVSMIFYSVNKCTAVKRVKAEAPNYEIFSIPNKLCNWSRKRANDKTNISFFMNKNTLIKNTVHNH